MSEWVTDPKKVLWGDGRVRKGAASQAIKQFKHPKKATRRKDESLYLPYLRMYDTYLQYTLALVVRAQTDTESRSQEKRDREGKNSILLESSRVESSSWKFF